METTRTWHHGLIAEWWANFATDGPEIGYYGAFVARGQPALDAGCGSGRLLLPWLHAGYDVDGSDVSADMIARCRERARREGLDPTLLVQPLHELEPPRRYATIVCCGTFGLGSTRAQDELALERFRDSLEPGGTLLLDMEMPWANARLWRCWTQEERKLLPSPWGEGGDRRPAPDGSELGLRSRTLAVDPLDQSVRLAMRAEKWRGSELVAAEEHELSMRLYFRDEMLLLLERAGFEDVRVQGGYEEREPAADDRMLVFVARAGNRR